MKSRTGQTTKVGPIQTQYSEHCGKVPSATGSAGGSFGKPLPEGPAPTKGIMGEVQYSELHKGSGGGKISGS